MKGIALHSIIPVRVEPKEPAEQETQMLFGETCEIVGEKGESQKEKVERRKSKGESQKEIGKWTYIRLDDDGEEGYVDTKMLTILSEQEAAEIETIYQNHDYARVRMPMAYAVSENNGQTIPLTAGTKLPNYHDGTFSLLGVRFRIDPQMVAEQPIELNETNLLNTVRFFINTPYLWGGKNALGIDCSGFTQTIYSLFGINLPRCARQQYTHEGLMHDVNLKDAKCGDLAFFDHANEQRASAGERRASAGITAPIIHVGILLDKERIIHASGRVKVEKIDEQGIYSAEQGKYTHHLAAIKRIMN